MPTGLSRHGHRHGGNLIREPQPEQSAWLPENFLVSRIHFSSVMTENRLLATSLSKKEIITKPTFVLLQLQLSTQLKNLYKTQMCVRHSAYISPRALFCLNWKVFSLHGLNFHEPFLQQRNLILAGINVSAVCHDLLSYQGILSVCHLSVCADAQASPGVLGVRSRRFLFSVKWKSLKGSLSIELHPSITINLT